jgi:hypothetical protein
VSSETSKTEPVLSKSKWPTYQPSRPISNAKIFLSTNFFPLVEALKAAIRHIPPDMPADEIYEALAELGFDVISVKQMSSNRRTPMEGSPVSYARNTM